MIKTKLKPEIALRVGLALVLIYAGVNALAMPVNWLGFVPVWVGSIVNPETFLFIHGVLEILLGIFLLLNFQTRIVSFVVFLDFLAILLLYGIDDVTFRDFGLLMTALGLFLIAAPKKAE